MLTTYINHYQMKTSYSIVTQGFSVNDKEHAGIRAKTCVRENQTKPRLCEHSEAIQTDFQLEIRAGLLH